MDEGEIEVDSIQAIGFPNITPELALESLGAIDLLKAAKHGIGENIYCSIPLLFLNSRLALASSRSVIPRPRFTGILNTSKKPGEMIDHAAPTSRAAGTRRPRISKGSE